MGALKTAADGSQGAGQTVLETTDAIFVEKTDGRVAWVPGHQVLDLTVGYLQVATANDMEFGEPFAQSATGIVTSHTISPGIDNHTMYIFFGGHPGGAIELLVNRSGMKLGQLVIITVVENVGFYLEVTVNGTTVITINPGQTLIACHSNSAGGMLRMIGMLVYGQLKVPDTTFGTTIGSQVGAESDRKWKLTGDVTGVPITSGWEGLYVNATAGDVTITPASGECVVVDVGATAPSVTIAPNKAVTVMGDGANLFVFGDVI